MDEARHGLAKGYTIEGYRIERVLGAGGFGITYLATETAIGRPVAIKEYLPNGIAARSRNDVSVQPLSSADEDNYQWGLERFRREAQTLVAFHHPNIVTVFRFFEANRTAYLVMAYEDGDSLASVLEKQKTLDEAALRDILQPLLSGLEHVHKAGFLHRDIKPGNIYIRRDGSPVLLDFGAARLAIGAKSQSLTSIVSAGYAPFEQYTTRGNQGPWTDLYSMGGVLYRAIAGQRPPDAPDRIRHDPYIPAAKAAKGRYSANFLAAIDAALIVDEEKRPQDLKQWRQVFDGARWPPQPRGGEAASDGPTADPGSATQAPMPPPPLAPPPASQPRASAPRATKRDEDRTRWPVGSRTGEATAPPVAHTAPPRAKSGSGKWIIIGGIVLAVLAAGGIAAIYVNPFGPDPKVLESARASLRNAEGALAQGDVAGADRYYTEAARIAPKLPELPAMRARIDAARAAAQRVDDLLEHARAEIEKKDYPAAEIALSDAEPIARQYNFSAKIADINRLRAQIEQLKRAVTAGDVPSGSWPVNAELRRSVDDTMRKLLARR